MKYYLILNKIIILNNAVACYNNPNRHEIHQLCYSLQQKNPTISLQCIFWHTTYNAKNEIFFYSFLLPVYYDVILYIYNPNPKSTIYTSKRIQISTSLSTFFVFTSLIFHTYRKRFKHSKNYELHGIKDCHLVRGHH